MACTSRLTAWRLPGGGATFQRKDSTGVEIKLKCGNCIGCRLEYSRNWAVRCMHEAQTTEEEGFPSSFITLTYADEKLPEDKSLDKTHVQKFIKRYRKWLSTNHPGTRIRYFHCGEYGDKFARPHYHILLFGHQFPDLVFHSYSQTGEEIFTSATLEKIWGNGWCPVGSLTWNSAAYTARYIFKKQNGNAAAKHYRRYDDKGDPLVDTSTGEILTYQQEYITASKRPGIGYAWFKKYWRDVFPSDEVVYKSKKGYRVMSAPPYYLELLKRQNEEMYHQVIEARRLKAISNKGEETPERQEARRICQEAKISKLKRTYHDS